LFRPPLVKLALSSPSPPAAQHVFLSPSAGGGTFICVLLPPAALCRNPRVSFFISSLPGLYRSFTPPKPPVWTCSFFGFYPATLHLFLTPPHLNGQSDFVYALSNPTPYFPFRRLVLLCGSSFRVMRDPVPHASSLVFAPYSDRALSYLTFRLCLGLVSCSTCFACGSPFPRLGPPPFWLFLAVQIYLFSLAFGLSPST